METLEIGQPLLISADELARLLGISTRTIWRRLSGGEIPKPVRLGKSVRWRLADIESWIDGGCIPPGDDPLKKGR